MLKELFESTFYITYPVKSHVKVALEEQVYSENFSLVDPKACRDCWYVCTDVVSERKQLLVDTHSDVHVISLDDVFGYVNEKLGDTCDYMLDDGQQIVLVEMTCSSSNYVISKRQKARGQLYNSLCVLLTNPELRRHIEEKQIRYVVFSWKETKPNSDGNKDSVEEGMLAMMGMVDEVYSPDNISKFDFDFLLKEIRYPHPFVWG